MYRGRDPVRGVCVRVTVQRSSLVRRTNPSHLGAWVRDDKERTGRLGRNHRGWMWVVTPVEASGFIRVEQVTINQGP